MKIASEYRIDKIQERQIKDPNFLRENMKRMAAGELGRKIAELIPYEKDTARSWPENQEVPDPYKHPIRSDEPFEDIYRMSVIILGAKDLEAIKQNAMHVVLDALQGRINFMQAAEEIMRAIEWGAQE